MYGISTIQEGPGRIANAPVPSIFVDDRGDIHRLRVGGRRLNLMHTVTGAMRSGYLHPHYLYSVVLIGRVEVWTLTETGTQKDIYGPYEHFIIAPYIPHILYFLAPTTMAEWWDAEVQFSCYYYHPYRKILDVQNSIFATTQVIDNNNGTHQLGHHQFLIPQDQASIQQNQRQSSYGTTLLWMTFAGLLGAAVGAYSVAIARPRR
jgi:hypothetical protein